MNEVYVGEKDNWLNFLQAERHNRKQECMEFLMSIVEERGE